MSKQHMIDTIMQSSYEKTCDTDRGCTKFENTSFSIIFKGNIALVLDKRRKPHIMYHSLKSAYDNMQQSKMLKRP